MRQVASSSTRSNCDLHFTFQLFSHFLKQSWEGVISERNQQASETVKHQTTKSDKTDCGFCFQWPRIDLDLATKSHAKICWWRNKWSIKNIVHYRYRTIQVLVMWRQAIIIRVRVRMRFSEWQCSLVPLLSSARRAWSKIFKVSVFSRCAFWNWNID